jgi:cyclomaltodextrinase / maltogenic alpha-amylase / neopullulanase
LALLFTASVTHATTEHLFQLDPRQINAEPSRVSVAGTFNSWSTSATPMQRGEDGVWRVRVPLNNGTHHYKFVLNGDQWINDPSADKDLEIDDNYGGKNSGVIIGPDIRKAPPPRSNHINSDFVVFHPQDDVSRMDDSTLRLRVRAQESDVEQVVAVGIHSDDQPMPLKRSASEGGYDIFQGRVDLDRWNRPEAGFALLFQEGTAIARLAPDGFVQGTEGRVSRGFHIPPPVSGIPEWTHHAVWYQIFVERFRNGDPSNDPGDADFENLVRWTSNWWETQPGEAPGTHNFYTGAGNVWKRRYGGDIQGVREKLPYLKSLGINAIYLNPIFEGESMHKYDTADFRHVDDNFGVKGDIAQLRGETDDPATWQWTASDKLFLDFLDDAREQGIRVIIDGVFNHVGRAHPFFMDVLEQGKKSRYADWFEITDWGDPKNWRKMDDPFEVHGKPGGIQWRAWDQENGHLPVFRKDDKLGLAPGPREHIFAVTKRWLAPDGDPSRGVDGFRLDVPGDIPHPFWVDWRKLVKETKPDAYTTGEIWNWAQPWLQGDQFDAVMNYQFAMAAQAFFVNERTAISPSEFDSRLLRIVTAYPWPITLAQQNLYDSHDTDRLASMFVNPDRPYDGANRLQDNSLKFDGPPYNARKPNDLEWTRFKQAVAFQMMFVGAPMIYYGSEAGMWSPDDPSNRMPMVWPDLEPYDDPQVTFHHDIFEHYQRMIAIRHKLPALRQGYFHSVKADDDRGLYTFARELDGQLVYVVVNRSNEKATIELPVAEQSMWLDWVNAQHATLQTEEGKLPQISPVAAGKGYRSAEGIVKVLLAPYGTAVLSAMD